MIEALHFNQAPAMRKLPRYACRLATPWLLLASLALAGAGRASERAPAASKLPAMAPGLSATPLRARVQPPHDETIQAFSRAPGQHAQVHALSDREWALVERAMDDLPALHRQVIERRLARLSFVDAPGSPGTALTRQDTAADGEPVFDITVRADVLETSLSDFLTGKDARLFSPDDSGYTVQVEASAASALGYLLLHEATHVVDSALKITTNGGLFRDLWTDYRTLAAPLDAGPLAHSLYRRGPPRPQSQAPLLYGALADSPFVSLYSTASAGEDFAELVAWRELSRRFNIRLTIWIRDSTGAVVSRIDPLASEAVQARMDSVETTLARLDAR